MSFATRLNWLLFGGDDKKWDKMFNFIADRLESLEALEKKVQALENKHEVLKNKTTGWQEGFSEGVKSQILHIEERIGKMAETDDSNVFELNQWIEEIKSLRKDLKALEKHVEAVERIKIVFAPKDGQSNETPVVPFYQPPVQPTRTWPGTDPLNPPYKITCQKETQ